MIHQNEMSKGIQKSSSASQKFVMSSRSMVIGRFAYSDNVIRIFWKIIWPKVQYESHFLGYSLPNRWVQMRERTNSPSAIFVQVACCWRRVLIGAGTKNFQSKKILSETRRFRLADTHHRALDVSRCIQPGLRFTHPHELVVTVEVGNKKLG